MASLTRLPNIGETLARELGRIGVTSREDLVALGSVEAARRIARNRSGPCDNLLFALEGAIRDVRWHSLSRSDRKKLKERFDKARHR